MLKKYKDYIFFLIFFIITILMSMSSFNKVDNDILWHLKLGEEILNEGITIKDTLSWQEGLSWISQEWLYDVYIYGIVKIFGNIGFIISMALTYLAIMIISYNENKNTLKSFFIFIPFLLTRNLFRQNIFNRPSLYSIIIIALIILAVVNEKNIKKKILKIFLFGILLANIHGGCLVSTLLILLIIAIIDFLLFLLKKDSIQKTKESFLCFITLIISGLINPFFYKIYIVGLKLNTIESTKYLSEFKSVNFDRISDILMVIFTLIVIISIVDSNEFKNLERKAIISLGLTCALFIGGLMIIRVLMILSVVILILDYKYLEEFILKYIKLLNIRIQCPKIFKKLNKENIYCYGIIILIVFSIITFSNLFKMNNDFNKHIEETSPYSYKIINYIKEELPKNAKIFNSYNTGNYLIYNNCKTFIDSRQQPFTREFYGNDSLNDYLKLVNSKNFYKVFMQLSNKYDIEYVFWSEEIALGYDIMEDFEKDWYIILEDEIIKENKTSKQYLLKRRQIE